MSKDVSGTATRRRYLKGTGSAIAALSLAGCMGGDGGGDGGDGDGDGGGTPTPTATATGTPTEAAAEEIVIGAPLGLSGPISQLAQNYGNGLRYAAEQLNNEDGVLGRPLTVKTVDMESDPTKAVTAFQRFVEEDGAVAGVGPVLSNVAIAVRQRAEQRQIPYLPAVGASGALLTEDTRYTFRLGAHPAPAFAQAVVNIAQTEGFSQIGSIYADYAWGNSFRKHLRARATDDIELLEFTAPVGESDFSSYLRQMPADVPMILGVSHPVGEPTLYRQIYELNMDPEIYPSGTSSPKTLWDSMGNILTRSHAAYTIYDPQSNAYQTLAQQYENDENSYFATGTTWGYVAVTLLAAAMEEAGSTAGPDVADALRNISFDTVYHSPIEYTEWGELQNVPFSYNSFTEGSPGWSGLADFTLENWHEFEIEPFKPWES